MQDWDGGRHAVRQGIGVERSRHARGQRNPQEEVEREGGTRNL